MEKSYGKTSRVHESEEKVVVQKIFPSSKSKYLS